MICWESFFFRNRDDLLPHLLGQFRNGKMAGRVIQVTYREIMIWKKFLHTSHRRGGSSQSVEKKYIFRRVANYSGNDKEITEKKVSFQIQDWSRRTGASFFRSNRMAMFKKVISPMVRHWEKRSSWWNFSRSDLRELNCSSLDMRSSHMDSRSRLIRVGATLNLLLIRVLSSRWYWWLVSRLIRRLQRLTTGKLFLKNCGK